MSQINIIFFNLTWKLDRNSIENKEIYYIIIAFVALDIIWVQIMGVYHSLICFDNLSTNGNRWLYLKQFFHTKRTHKDV